MRTLVIGCNHRSAAVELRERIAFDAAAVPRALQLMKERFPACEAVLVSTCNRMEWYISRPIQERPRVADMVEFIGAFHNVPPAEFATSLYHHEDAEAVRHLFRVVSALDSMVLGETQILAQARDAFDLACSLGTAGGNLKMLFQRAFAVGKDVQNNTAIAAGRLSVGSTAVDLARQIFSRFDDKTVMMVGAGEMGELTLTHLMETNPKELWVTNRTDERATALADRLRERHKMPISPVPYVEWIDRLATADIVISCTGAREPILTTAEFRKIPAKRRYRPLLLIDIAVPRDIEPAIADEEEVYLYNIDDLQEVVEATLASRKGAIQQCHAIIEQSVIEFLSRQSARDIGPLIGELQQHFHEVGRRELDRILPKCEALSAHDRQLVEEMLHRVAQKLLHDPVQLLHEKSANGAASVYADTLRALFRLTDRV